MCSHKFSQLCNRRSEWCSSEPSPWIPVDVMYWLYFGMPTYNLIRSVKITDWPIPLRCIVSSFNTVLSPADLSQPASCRPCQTQKENIPPFGDRYSWCLSDNNINSKFTVQDGSYYVWWVIGSRYVHTYIGVTVAWWYKLPTAVISSKGRKSKVSSKGRKGKKK